jgi:predicted metalloprotease with PDZ domain
MIDRAGPAATAKVHAFRRDELMTFEVTPVTAPLDTCWLTLKADAPQAATALRESWLRGSPPTA